jgi:hypothetical protein
MSGSTSRRDGGDPSEPLGLRRLRRLVTALTAVLIFGVITVVGLLVIRLAALAPAAPPALPPAVALPAGERAGAVTFGAGWAAVVTTDAAGVERIRVYDADSGAERASLVLPAGE